MYQRTFLHMLTGVVFIISGIICAILFEKCIVSTAFTPNKNGQLGELYMPVAFFRIPVDAACGFMTIVGASICIVFSGE